MAAATADLPRQHSPYGERVMRLCVYQVVTLRKSASEVAAGLGNHPCPKTIQGWVRDSLQTGGDIIAPTGRLGIRHEKRKADDWAKTCLEILVHDHESHSLADFALSMRDMTGVGPWSEMMISRALHEMGYSQVRVINRAREANDQKRAEFRAFIHSRGWAADDMAFGDETAMDRKCLNATTAWVKTGGRSKGLSLFIRGDRYTIIGVITVNGVLCYKVILGSATAEIFGLFYANEVVPRLQHLWHGPSVFVADNGSAHRKSEMLAIAHGSGQECIFLPPYSPDFNPIEKAWGKFKGWLRANRDRLFYADPLAIIGEGMATITAQDCRSWIEFEPDLY